MKYATAGLLVALLAQPSGPAVALSCDRFGIHGTYILMQGSTVQMLLAHGKFSDLQPVTIAAADRPPVILASGFETWSAQFTGYIGSPTGFDQPVSAQVTLILPDYSGIGGTDTAAAVVWLPEKTGLVWLSETTSGYQLFANPCQNLIDTDPASVPLALRCLQGDDWPKV